MNNTVLTVVDEDGETLTIGPTYSGGAWVVAVLGGTLDSVLVGLSRRQCLAVAWKLFRCAVRVRLTDRS